MSLSCQPLSTAAICLLDHETCLGCSCRLPAVLTQEGQWCSLCVSSRFRSPCFTRVPLTLVVVDCRSQPLVVTLSVSPKGRPEGFLRLHPILGSQKESRTSLQLGPSLLGHKRLAVSDVSQLSSSIRIIVQRGDSLQGLANSATVRL